MKRAAAMRFGAPDKLRSALIGILFCSTLLAGCGGGGGGGSGGREPPPPPDTELRVTGTVQKGLFQFLDVSAFPVNESNGSLGTRVNVPVSGQSFSVEIAKNQLTLFEASGTFTSEITGTSVTTDRPLKLILPPGSSDRTGNINIATTLVAELVLRDLRAGGGNASTLIQRHTDFINTVFGFPPGTDPALLDFNAITESSDMTDPNLQLLILSGGLVEILTGDRLYADGFQVILDGILAAESVEEAIAVVSILNGLSANAIYSLAQQYSGFNLPMLVLGNNFYVYVCNASNSCSWQAVTLPLVSVSGSSAWEAGGKARIYVRLNQPSAETVRVNLTTASGTATSGEDFIGLAQQVTFTAGQVTVTRELDLMVDAEVESNETATVMIESLTESYGVFQGVADVTIRDGASVSLANQDAAGMQFVSFDVAALCNPVVNMGDTHCLQLDGSESSLPVVANRPGVARVSVDLAANCVDASACPQKGRNWLVNFFLVARDSGSPVAEVPLGPYIYTFDSVQLVSEPARARTALVRLTDAAAITLSDDAAANGWNLVVEARLGTANTVAASDPVAPFLPVPDSVVVGDTVLEIGVVRTVSDGATAGCADGQYAIDGDFYQAGSTTRLVSGTLCVDYDAAGVGAGPAVMVAGSLDAFGGTAAPDVSTVVALPDGLYARVSANGRASTLPALLLIGPASGLGISNELHAQGWPFLFRINRLSLTPAGIELGYDDMRYVMDVGYSAQDPRSLGVLSSNDIYYQGVAGQSGSLLLGPAGVSGAVSVQATPGPAASTAFPRAGVEWQSFNQSIDDNRLQPTTIAIDEYRLVQRTSCSGPDCVRGGVDLYSVAAAALLLDGDGFVVGDASNIGSSDEPRWGARGAGNHAWSRPDDLTAQQQLKLAVPGYVLPADAAASDYLVAHLNEPTSGSEIARYPVGSDAFVDGNYHPVGLSLGPEIYRNGSGVPDPGDGQDLSLFGGRLRLDNGQDPAFDLQSSVAVKYVIRNAGITGVFNVSSGSLGGAAPQFYGYALDLARFAVRSVDNVLDTYNWIDGRLALQGDAGGPDGLDLWFANLQIDCSARLGNVDLLYEACDGKDNNGNGEIDENCGPALYSWKAETDIFAAGFSGGSAGQVCAAGPQTFGLQHQLRFAALDKPVAFETQWTPAGTLAAQTSGELSAYRFDRSDEGEGFPVKTDGAKLDARQVDGDGYGWLELPRGQVGVPFWNAIDADLRVANARPLDAILPEPTVVVKSGDLAFAEANPLTLNPAQRNKAFLRAANEISASDDAREIKVAYEWGRTGFGFRLPVYYQPWQLDSGRSDADARGRQSRFLGRDLTKDLFVLDARAGINFIEPDRTKLSFGASADFTRLEGVTFQVDISDPDSAAAVDDLLQDLRIINGPLFEPALTEFLDTINVVNRYASRGMDELMQASLEIALEEIGEATAPLTPNGQDPFVTASELLTQVRSLPQQGIALLNSELRAPLDARLFTMENQLRVRLQAFEAQLVTLPANATPAQIDTAFAAVDDLLLTLDELVVQAEAVDAEVEGVQIAIESVRDRAIASLLELQQATYDIELAVAQAVTFADDACSGGFISTGEGTGYLNDVAVRFAAIRRVADIIQGTTQWLDAAETIAKNSDVKERLGQAKQRIKEATAEVLGFINDADDALGSLLCDSGQVDAVVARVFDYTAKVRGHLGPILIAIAENSAGVSSLGDLRSTLRKRVIEPIDALRSGLQVIRDDAADFSGVDLNAMAGCILYNATHEASECLDPASVPAAQAPFGINSIAASGVGERDLADLVFDGARQNIAAVFDGVEEALLAFTGQVLPGAYMSPEQLRRMLVSEIMATQPIKDLRAAMDRHFAEIAYAMNGIVLQVIDQANLVINDALASVTGPVNDALSEALAGVRGIPLQAAGIDGFATIAGNELERAHISAGWTMRGSDDNDSTGFRAALDAESWSARHVDPDLNTPTACNVGENSSLLDVKISAYGLPINVLAADITIDKLYLGFTLQGNEGQTPALLPVGIFGGINTIGEIGFTDAVVFDPAFAAALGLQQTYIGASAGAVFSSLAADVAFLIGRVCPGNTVLTDLDPDVEKFLPNLPASGFTGAYLRGGATIPIIPGGCFLNVGVVADFGSWVFVGSPTTFGGLVGGGATGEIACIAALKGKAQVGGSVTTDGDLKLRGEAWGVAGAGLDCDPGTWTSVARSRDDDWCGTGDAQFDLTFDNGKWLFTLPKPSMIH